MSHVTHCLFVIALCSSLSLQVFSQTNPSAQKSEIVFTDSSVEWPAPVPDGGLLLTVSGPEGLYVRQEYPAGHWPRFSLVDGQGQARPDGVYKWELVVQSGWEGVVRSGWFEIREGRPVAEGAGEQQPVAVEETAPQNSLYLDGQGRLGLGTTVPQSQLHLKGTSPAFTLEDTTAGGRAFALRSLEKGDGSFGLFDQMTGEARWLVDSEGRIGIGTTKPTSTLTVDGYVEATKGFLVNGKPVGMGLGLIGGSQPLSSEGDFNGNSYFGTNAGTVLTNGFYNSFFGVDSGSTTTSGAGNTFMGWGAGSSNASGNDNSFFGAGAGRYNTASNNAFFGQNAGNQNTTGSFNSFFGQSAGYSNGEGASNSFFGTLAGQYNTTGRWNSFFGALAGQNNDTGINNSFFGMDAGNSNMTGHSNSFFGYFAGFSNMFENYNTFVGSLANLVPQASSPTNPITNATAIGARASVAQSNSLVLGSIPNVNQQGGSYVNVGNGTTTPYYSIHVMRTGANAAVMAQRTDGAANYMNAGPSYANFGSANNYPLRLTVNASWRLQLNTDDSLSMVNGASCSAGGVWTNGSSREYKDNISALSSEEAMETLDGLSPVKFNYKADESETYVGFIAEDVPDLVATNDRKSLSPMDLVAVLTRVVQEQQKTIQYESKTNEEQRAELDSLKAEVEALKELLRGK